MEIAILTSGILPVPAVRGGAVENLVDFYMEYNDRHRLHNITVYSIADRATTAHKALTSSVNHYKYIKTTGLFPKIKKHIIHRLRKNKEYYHHTIEYYFHEALKDIAKHNYDTIIIENRPGYVVQLRKNTHARLILHLHNDLLNNEIPKARTIYDSLSRIVCVSDYIADRVRTLDINQKETDIAAQKPAAENKVITVHNGIDTTSFAPIRQCLITRESLGIAPSDFVLVFSGRINREKGISELTDAMLLLKKESDIKLLVIGGSFYGNTTSEDPFIKELKAKTEPIRHKIIFTGFIPYNEIPAYLAVADVAVVPSVWNDPFPTTVLEAQAMGLPIITTTRGGIPEEVCEDNAILLSPDKNFPEQLADAITSLRDNPQKCADMRDASQRHAVTFTKERYSYNLFKAIEP